MYTYFGQFCVYIYIYLVKFFMYIYILRTLFYIYAFDGMCKYEYMPSCDLSFFMQSSCHGCLFVCVFISF